MEQTSTTLSLTVTLSPYPIFYWAQCGNDRNNLNEIHIFNKAFKCLLYSVLQKLSLVAQSKCV
jgi:hypothetical protein